ncbi:MAG: hypothetical protein UT24_C0003G0056 [Candidatus Woesebacteria bacterium GW2011_GWB1_39_12]|uniref:HicB-like antitoxin of toxin-antitoxin system domain-containing protein n=1 Tax=Candidatus Woesebacteria bacterium GW2011_GWB1_39_12 TaxID=1618574 RepID=A0A0G0MC90_9BACT|nr:MAG: hypothetical protein UT24_C0003G0056 [Candidatus Woesebacteria bacterium GW2011_GWB1_39_12]
MKIIKVKVKRREFRVKVRDGEDGYLIAQCIEPELSGALTQGKTMKEIVRNIKEAIELVLDVLEEEKK